MDKTKDVIITGYSNLTSEGLTLKLNKPVPLGEGRMATDEWWVSWDKIGEALFPDSYTNKITVEDRNKLRKK